MSHIVSHYPLLSSHFVIAHISDVIWDHRS